MRHAKTQPWRMGAAAPSEPGRSARAKAGIAARRNRRGSVCALRTRPPPVEARGDRRIDAEALHDAVHELGMPEDPVQMCAEPGAIHGQTQSVLGMSSENPRAVLRSHGRAARSVQPHFLWQALPSRSAHLRR